MLDLLLCECLKLKRKRLFKTAAFTSVIFPILFASFTSSDDFDDMVTIVREFSGFLLLIPLLVILAANLFFGEHDNNTLKNLVCIPVSKSSLVLVKVFVLFLFSITYELIGFIITVLLAVFQKVPFLTDWGMQLILTLGTGALLWAAVLPCMILVIWSNKSYIISVIISFFYTVLNYLFTLSDAVMMQPLGLHTGTLMPVPMIFRWLYQYHVPQGELMTSFYRRFSPYFASPLICFGVLGAEAALCILLICRIYQRQEI